MCNCLFDFCKLVYTLLAKGLYVISGLQKCSLRMPNETHNSPPPPPSLFRVMGPSHFRVMHHMLPRRYGYVVTLSVQRDPMV
ncbi:hypothetical protein STEG23_025667, partial [Scotinomys teguina]